VAPAARPRDNPSSKTAWPPTVDDSPGGTSKSFRQNRRSAPLRCAVRAKCKRLYGTLPLPSAVPGGPAGRPARMAAPARLDHDRDDHERRRRRKRDDHDETEQAGTATDDLDESSSARHRMKAPSDFSELGTGELTLTSRDGAPGTWELRHGNELVGVIESSPRQARISGRSGSWAVRTPESGAVLSSGHPTSTGNGLLQPTSSVAGGNARRLR
jgi:hypothetical protein